MAQNSYGNTTGRVNVIKGPMLAVAEVHEVLAFGCKMEKFPKNKGDTIKYRARVPTGGSTSTANTQNRWSVTAANYATAEGVTPSPKSVSYRDVTVTMTQYAVLYSYTDKAADLHEDDIPEDQMLQVAEEMGLVREMIRYGEMKAATNVQYVGGTSRATVASAISYNALSLMSRTLQANGAKMVTSVLAGGPDQETSPIEAGFVVFVHTDAEHDVRALQDFVPVAKYGTRKPINEHELGSVGRFRFITSKELFAYADAGVAVGSTGLYSTTGSNIDVYPFIVCAQEAAFDVSLGFNFKPSHIRADQQTKDDPLGMRGYVGSKWYQAPKVVNHGWFGVLEAGISSLT